MIVVDSDLVESNRIKKRISMRRRRGSLIHTVIFETIPIINWKTTLWTNTNII
jgi:hypothetical protein